MRTFSALVWVPWCDIDYVDGQYIVRPMKDYAPHFRAPVESNLPDDSRILMPHGGRDIIILVTWRLKDALRASNAHA